VAQAAAGRAGLAAAEVDAAFEERAASADARPLGARDDYISVLLDRRRNTIPFLAKHTRGNLSQDEVVTVLELMELQRHAMLMYTSCGWFFNDVSGIETVQVLQYAGRVVQLAERLFGDSLRRDFLERLEEAKSNLPDMKNGRAIYEQQVSSRPRGPAQRRRALRGQLALRRRHPESRIYCYRRRAGAGRPPAERRDRAARGPGPHHVQITQETAVVTFAVLHFGNHNLTGGIRRFAGEDEFRALRDELLRAFSTADIPAVVRLLANFPEYTFSLKSLFGDRQRSVLTGSWSPASATRRAYRRLYEDNASLMRFLIAQDLPLPRAFRMAAEFVLNGDLREVFTARRGPGPRPRAARGGRGHPRPARPGGPQLRRGTCAAADRGGIPGAPPRPGPARDVVGTGHGLTEALPFDVNLWKSQNVFYDLLKTVYPSMTERAASRR
jgi:hypothetical protein